MGRQAGGKARTTVCGHGDARQSGGVEGGELRELAPEGDLVAGPRRPVELLRVAASRVDGVRDGGGRERVADRGDGPRLRRLASPRRAPQAPRRGNLPAFAT